VVVGDHGQVAVTLAVGGLVDADPVQPVQAGVIEVGATTRTVMAATASQQQRSSRVMVVLSVRWAR
jgi:hypothetical protein